MVFQIYHLLLSEEGILNSNKKPRVHRDVTGKMWFGWGRREFYIRIDLY